MPTLDQGPPPPPGVGAPQASMSALAGQSQTPQSQPQMQQAVLEKMMIVEKTLQDAATIMPALSPVVSDMIQQFRSRVGAIVLQSSQQGDQQPQGLSSLLSGGSPAPATS